MCPFDVPMPDDFPGGCLISNGVGEAAKRTIVYANRYTSDLLGLPNDNLVGLPLARLLTRASGIMVDSYVMPTLMHRGHCKETLLDVRHADGTKVPVLVNAMMQHAEPSLVYWSLLDATEHNNLYHELVLVRRRLEEKAEMLQKLSITDELTGLLNRRELHRLADLIIAQAIRSSTPIAVLVLDIDYFKVINDTHGHAEGDLILQCLARHFQEGCREADIMARYGGEEFVFVLYDTEETGARLAADRLHEMAARIRIDDRPLTVSIGIGLSGPEAQLSYQDLFEMADRAVYAAKAAGRNQSAVYRAS